MDNLGRVVLPPVLLEQLRVKTGEQVVIVSYDHESMKILKAEPSDNNSFS